MTNQKDQKLYELGDKGKDFSESVHAWLAQYDEEDDFLCGKTSNSLPEFTEEELKNDKRRDIQSSIK